MSVAILLIQHVMVNVMQTKMSQLLIRNLDARRCHQEMGKEVIVPNNGVVFRSWKTLYRSMGTKRKSKVVLGIYQQGHSNALDEDMLPT